MQRFHNTNYLCFGSFAAGLLSLFSGVIFAESVDYQPLDITCQRSPLSYWYSAGNSKEVEKGKTTGSFMWRIEMSNVTPGAKFDWYCALARNRNIPGILLKRNVSKEVL